MSEIEIPFEKIREAIEKSGYLLEQKTVIEFEKHGFFTGPNFAFEDQDEKKSREIDFIATKYIDYEIGKTGFYFSAFSEVKKRTNPLVFFEKKPHYNEFLDVYIPLIATQPFFSHVDLGLNINKILNLSEIHHQVTHKLISTQFCEIDLNKKKAEHKTLYETLFVPLIKCIDSEYLSINKYTKFFDPENPIYFLNILHPILIVSGPLLAYDIYTDSLIEKDYIIYRRHYQSSTVKRTLLIDVVAENSVSEYVSNKLNKTFNAISDSLKRNLSKIIEYCYKDKVMLDLRVKEIQKKIQ